MDVGDTCTVVVFRLPLQSLHWRACSCLWVRHDLISDVLVVVDFNDMFPFLP